MSNITLNIVEPGGPTPDPVVPNTGLFTHGIGGPEATIITAVSAVLLLTIVAVVVAMLYKKHKKQGKLISLKHSKATTMGLTTLALLVSIGTVAGLLKLGASAADDGLTVTSSSGELTIEVGSEPVFAVLPVEVTVEEATQAGYTLTAYSDNTDLVSTTDSSKVIPMVAVDESELAALTDNTYGLALYEKPTTKDAEVYMPLSIDSDTPTILKATDYIETEANDTTTIYYGFYITPDVPYGTYEGSNINYQAEPNHITNLSFDGNGSDGGVAMEGMTIIAGDTITLPENTFAKEGYNFIGWNTVAEPTEQDPGETYADEAEFTASLDKSEDVTLYAQWALPVIGDLTEMQDFAKLTEAGKASVLKSMTPGQQYQLIDNRGDKKSYYIAKLADGNIWMTQNLDLDIEAGKTYTSADTDLANSTIGTSWTPTVSTSTTSSWTSSTTAPESYDPGDLYWDGTLNTNWNGNLSNETVTDPPTTGGTHYHIGNYYNWTAAVAMNDSSGKNSGDMNQSICPAGWRLPNHSENKSYQNLVDTLSLTAGTGGNIQNSLVYFVYGGGWYGSSDVVGSYGDYWSSVVGSSSSAYLLVFDVGGGLYPQGSLNRGGGYSLRCVAR